MVGLDSQINQTVSAFVLCGDVHVGCGPGDRSCLRKTLKEAFESLVTWEIFQQKLPILRSTCINPELENCLSGHIKS